MLLQTKKKISKTLSTSQCHRAMALVVFLPCPESQGILWAPRNKKPKWHWLIFVAMGALGHPEHCGKLLINRIGFSSFFLTFVINIYIYQCSIDLQLTQASFSRFTGPQCIFCNQLPFLIQSLTLFASAILSFLII